MTTHRLRAATPADYPAYCRLFPELHVDDAPSDEVRYEAEMMPATIVAERGGVVEGYASWRVVGVDGHLMHLIAGPTARRIGLGRMLLAAAIARMKSVGCTSVTLNVLAKNTAATTLYASVGFRTVFTSRALRFGWDVLDALPPVPAVRAREIAPADDARLEARYALSRGTLAGQRPRPDRVLRAIEDDGGCAFAVFDRAFPGAYPFFATDADYALALLRELRPHARPGDAMLNLALEQQRDLATALLARGATLRFETERMRVSI